MIISTLQACYFEASEDIMTKFKSKALHIIRIKYLKASGSGNTPPLIPVLWNISILLHKQATHGKHFGPECKQKVGISVVKSYNVKEVLGLCLQSKTESLWLDLSWVIYHHSVELSMLSLLSALFSDTPAVSLKITWVKSPVFRIAF